MFEEKIVVQEFSTLFADKEVSDYEKIDSDSDYYPTLQSGRESRRDPSSTLVDIQESSNSSYFSLPVKKRIHFFKILCWRIQNMDKTNKTNDPPKLCATCLGIDMSARVKLTTVIVQKERLRIKQ